MRVSTVSKNFKPLSFTNAIHVHQYRFWLQATFKGNVSMLSTVALHGASWCHMKFHLINHANIILQQQALTQVD